MNCSSVIRMVTCACLSLVGIAMGHNHSPSSNQLFFSIGNQEKKDLELFTLRDNTSPGVIAHCKSPQTTHGTQALRTIFSTPTTDISLLSQRQEVIRYLTNNPLLLQQLEAEFTTIKACEASLEYLQSADPLHQKIVQDLYIPWQRLSWLNKHPLALDTWFASHIVLLALPTLEHMAVHYLLSEKLQDTLGLRCANPFHNHHKHTEHHHGHEHDHHHTHDHNHHDHDHGQTCDHTPARWALNAYNAYNIVHMAIHAYGLVGLANNVKGTLSILKELQTHLIAVQQLVTAVDTVHQLLDAHPILNNLLAPAFTITPEETNKNSVEVDLLRQQLHSRTFTGNASLFSRPGTILAAYQQVRLANQELTTLLAEIGTYDAVVALVTTYARSQHASQRYTFAQYSTAATPHLSIRNAWHPLMAGRTMSPITLELGSSNNPRSALITGANMAGKSTHLKTTALCVVFAQTCGFVPAHAMVLTPFSAIQTACSIDDNIQGGMSGFASECACADAITQKALTTNGFSLVISDELFRGTSAEKGTNYLVDFVTLLCQQPTVCLLATTHFESVVQRCNALEKVLKHYHAQAEHQREDCPTYSISCS